MAVSKMVKWVVLVEERLSNVLLESIQALQSFEVIDVPMETKAVDKETLPQTIQNLEQDLSNIRTAQDILKKYVPKKQLPKRFSMTLEDLTEEVYYIKERSVCVDVLSLAKEKEAFLKRKAMLKEQEDTVMEWQALPFLPKQIQAMQTMSVLIGTIPQSFEHFYQQVKENNAFIVECLFENKHETGIVVYTEKHTRQDVMDLLTAYHFSKYDYPFSELPAIEKERIQQDLKIVDEHLAEIETALASLSQNYVDLLLLEETTYNEKERLIASQWLLSGENVTALTGWLESDKSELFLEQLQQTLPKDSYVCLQDDEKVEEAVIPTVLKNHPLVEPFEVLTEMYMLPKYSEIDPTPLFAPFYAVFFGMMISDLGYGLLLWLGTFYALKYVTLSKTAKKNIKMFHILSYPSMLWGIIFGSFFSFDLPFKLLSATNDAISILLVSIVFGLIQLITGLAINTHIKLKEKNYSSAVSDGLGWIGLLIGSILLVISAMSDLEWLASLANYMLLASVLSIVLGTAFGSSNKLLGIGSGLYKLYGASSYIGDIASYSRLMALCVAGASIGSSFNLIINLLPLPARLTIGIVLFIVLQLLNFGLSLLSAYVHGIRLQFVEYFGKFYEGGGKKLKPLKLFEKHITIEERKITQTTEEKNGSID